MIATQHSLVARLKEHPCDSDWEKFYRYYAKPILAVAAAKGLSEADCQDVLLAVLVGGASGVTVVSVMIPSADSPRFSSELPRTALSTRSGAGPVEILTRSQAMLQRRLRSIDKKTLQTRR